MKVPRVMYQGPPQKHSWLRYILYRIKKNQNFLGSIVGPTGSGKTYAGLWMGEEISRMNGVPFTIENVVFSLRELMQLINSKQVKSGSVIIFDEPQVSISAREFQSMANRVFNYLLTTFRHRNFILLFCTPYSDLLDKTARKLFHAQFETIKIDRKENKVVLKPLFMEYNSNTSKFYSKFLHVWYKEPNYTRYTKQKLKRWGIPKPSKDIILEYERKKRQFTDRLNKNIEDKLIEFDAKNNPETKQVVKLPLTPIQEMVLKTYQSCGNDKHKTAELMDMSVSNVFNHIKLIRKKGHVTENE